MVKDSVMPVLTASSASRRPAEVDARCGFVLSRLAALVTAGLLSAAAPFARGDVIADVLQAGYRADTPNYDGARYVRSGEWFPVTVELTLQNQTSFEGFIRVKQRDSDGDFLFDQKPVSLRVEAGPVPFEMFVVAGAAERRDDLVITIVDKADVVVPVVYNGERVRRIELTAPQLMPPGSDLLLAVTPPHRPAGRVSRLVAPDQADKFRSQLFLSTKTTSRLPTHWIGLAMVDYIVWDEADATELVDRRQAEALIEWVKQGGTLLIASARTADTLASSEIFEPILPVTFDALYNTHDLPELRRRGLGVSAIEIDAEPGYRVRPVTVLASRAKDDAGNVNVVIEDRFVDAQGQENRTDLITRHRVGRGHVVFVGGSLRELLNTQGSPAMFFQRVLWLRAPVGMDQGMMPEGEPLFPYLQQMVGFSRYGGAYLVLALLFAIVYLGVSTFGVWTFLRARGWLNHNWLAFAALSIIACVASVSAVQALRGVGPKLDQLSIVDIEAGRLDARATAYFGLKTGTRSLIDIWLPRNEQRDSEPSVTPCTLAPLIEARERFGTAERRYTDTAEYKLRPTNAQIEDVLVRATLKRFTGTWHGDLPGGISAKVIIDRNRTFEFTNRTGEVRTIRTDVISAASTITSNLGVDLEQCYLLQATMNPFLEGSLAQSSPRGEKNARAVFAHQVRGGLKHGETIKLADRIYKNPNGTTIPVQDWFDRNHLHNSQRSWSRYFRTADLNAFGSGSNEQKQFDISGNYQNALLLATTASEFDPQQLRSRFQQTGRIFLTDQCRELDLSDVLTKNVVILIGFTNDPGPVTLCTGRGGNDYRPIEPARAWTMYRIVIPVAN